MLISLLLIAGALLPASARAGVLQDILGLFPKESAAAQRSDGAGDDLQTMPLLQPAMNVDPSPATGGGGISIVDNSALVPEEGPAGTIADIEKPKGGMVSLYIVREGDTLGAIAQMFNVNVNTILWANDLTRSSKLQIGEKLVVLPIDSVPYTVQKGDTLASIAKKTGGDAAEIGTYNGVDDSTLAAGAGIIIPNGEAPGALQAGKHVGAAKKERGSASSDVFARNPAEPAHDVGPRGDSAEIAYYIAPLSNYIETQGIHGYNAVDLAAPMWTPIMAAATGDVVVARAGGWNGGYGSYVVISHNNGSQTLYAHMSKVAAYDGEHVMQGQIIGYVGETGEATGPHVHFEIRNGIRNPF